MCLQVARQVISIEGEKVIVQGGQQLLKTADQQVKVGDFVLAYGNIIVTVLPKKVGRKLQATLKKEIDKLGQ